MKYGMEVSKGHRLVYQFVTENQRTLWLAQGEGRSAINGNAREVKRALYHGEVRGIGEREKEISNP